MKCPKCNKEGAYIRVRKQDIFCRLCGQSSKIDNDPSGAESENNTVKKDK